MRELTLQTLQEALSSLTGTPVEEMTDPVGLLRRLPAMQAELRRRLIGQEQAVEVVVQALRARLLRQSAERPVLNVLCCGPSGVGKTELARQLARVCMGGPGALIRLDGSEYREPHSIARLIGAPPGYVGHGPGQLTDAVRRRPRSVVLFDEFEKACSEVQNAFLQVMSAGRLTDATGYTVDCRRTMVVLTSNLGSRPTDGVAPDPELFELDVKDTLARKVRPEILGRLDALVVFQHLDMESVRAIVRLKLNDTAQDIAAVSGFEVSERAEERLAREAYSPDAGAREVDRVLRQRIDPAIAAMLEMGLLNPAHPSRVRIDYADGEYLFDPISSE